MNFNYLQIIFWSPERFVAPFITKWINTSSELTAIQNLSLFWKTAHRIVSVEVGSNREISDLTSLVQNLKSSLTTTLWSTCRQLPSLVLWSKNTKRILCACPTRCCNSWCWPGKKVMASRAKMSHWSLLHVERREDKIDLKQSWRILLAEGQIIFHKKQALQAKYELLKEKAVV